MLAWLKLVNEIKSIIKKREKDCNKSVCWVFKTAEEVFQW